MARIGVLSDLHCELEPSGSRWLNPFESTELDRRLDEALAWFAELRIDVVLLLGDLVQFANVSDLEHVLARVEAADVAPAVLVNGNHDVRLGGELASRTRAHGITVLHEQPMTVGGVALVGVEVARGTRLPQYVGTLGPLPEGGTVVVVASHFPLLSEASRVAAAGVPYAGDIANRAELEAQLGLDDRPKLVLSGHIHARCTTHAGSLLQFTVGALIEPPFDATVIDVDAGALSVTRTARRLGDIAPLDPVFAADREAWSASAGSWRSVGTADG